MTDLGLREYAAGLQAQPELEIRVFCILQFEGFHCWPQAPDEVDFLRRRHRHIFHVRAEKIVQHDDRDVEFILLKREIQRSVEAFTGLASSNTWSCERWARELLTAHNLDKVEVSEDGENGAIVERRR